MTDHRWAFCSDPECLLCATHAPRRDVPAEPAPAANLASESAPETVSFRVTHPIPGLPGIDGMAAVYEAAMNREADVARIARIFGVPRDMLDGYADRPDHVHWAAGPQQAPRPWYLRAATRLVRMQPINTVRDRVRVQWDRRSWYVGVFVGRDGIDVHLLCLALVIDCSRHGWLRK
jgi:hypothetical protein